MKALTILIGSCMLLTACFSGNKKADIPSFNLLLTDSVTQFNTSQIPNDKPIAFVFFSPDCEHCQQETSDILKHMDSLKDVRFYFVSVDQIERLKVFRAYYQLHRYPNITVGRDYTFTFPIHFQVTRPPCLILFDRHKKEKAVFTGETTASKLIEVMNKVI